MIDYDRIIHLASVARARVARFTFTVSERATGDGKGLPPYYLVEPNGGHQPQSFCPDSFSDEKDADEAAAYWNDLTATARMAAEEEFLRELAALIPDRNAQ